MAVNSVNAFSVFSSEVGTINATWTFVSMQTFNTPRNLQALPLLRYISETNDTSGTEAYISAYWDNGTKIPGHFAAIGASKCTQINWSLYCNDSYNNPTALILFFD
jgi:hypothetical protein